MEQARRLVVRSSMGFGSNAHYDKGPGHKTTGFRADSSRSGTTPAHDWAEALGHAIARLDGVTIERRPAMQVMAAHDCDVTENVMPEVLAVASGKGEGAALSQATPSPRSKGYQTLLHRRLPAKRSEGKGCFLT